jgi:hypothetical protein
MVKWSSVQMFRVTRKYVELTIRQFNLSRIMRYVNLQTDQFNLYDIVKVERIKHISLIYMKC